MHTDPIQHLSVDSDADVDLVKINGLTWMKYLGISTSLVTMHVSWVGHTTAVGQTESTELMTSQSPGTKHYVWNVIIIRYWIGTEPQNCIN